MTALVILPGLDGTATLHAQFVAATGGLFSSVEAIAYPPRECLGYAELEARVRAALPRTAPFVLLGESFSGPIALSIAASPPPNLKAVVLSTSFARSPLPWLSPLAALTRIVPVHAMPAALLSWWLLGRWATPDLETALQGAVGQVSPSVLGYRAAAALRARVDGVERIAVPLLYLRATGDRLLPGGAGELLCSTLEHCTLVDIPGPHLLLQAAPQACARAIGDFLDAIASAEDQTSRANCSARPV